MPWFSTRPIPSRTRCEPYIQPCVAVTEITLPSPSAPSPSVDMPENPQHRECHRDLEQSQQFAPQSRPHKSSVALHSPGVLAARPTLAVSKFLRRAESCHLEKALKVIPARSLAH